MTVNLKQLKNSFDSVMIERKNYPLSSLSIRLFFFFFFGWGTCNTVRREFKILFNPIWIILTNSGSESEELIESTFKKSREHRDRAACAPDPEASDLISITTASCWANLSEHRWRIFWPLLASITDRFSISMSSFPVPLPMFSFCRKLII